ncbi:MAG: FAD-dependent oxidoreductase, partial [Steroidobacteraceae bacterium]
MQYSLGRREFMTQAMAGTAVLALPAGSQAAIASLADTVYDLVIVGAGTAGLPAAIFAAQRGAKVILLEAAGQIGGTLHLSTGQMSAAGTRLQRAKGIKDTPDMHYDDVMRISRGTADPVLTRLAVDAAAETFDWLMDRGFAPLDEHPILGLGHEP